MIRQTYASFFEELEVNNHKDWFQSNKHRYENDVKIPFISLLEAIIDGIQSFDPEISTDPKAAIFRINRDIRFSKDKTPYNTLMKAGIAPGGKRSALPGYYLGIGAKTIHVGGGMFGVDKDQLKQIRNAIANDYEGFARIVHSSDFKAYFGALKGEQAKRLEPDYKALMEVAPFIANKQFYAMAEIQLKSYMDTDDLHSVLMQHFKAIYPLNRYLKNILM